MSSSASSDSEDDQIQLTEEREEEGTSQFGADDQDELEEDDELEGQSASSETQPDPQSIEYEQDERTQSERGAERSLEPTTQIYAQSVQERMERLASRRRPILSEIMMDSLVTLPHGTEVQCIALPSGANHFFTGGQDGFIRRYALRDTTAGLTELDNLITRTSGKNVHGKAVHGIPSGHYAAPQGVLVGYWENLDLAPQTMQYGPRGLTHTGPEPSPVYSLAIHSQELWGLSGTISGAIHLWSVRLDEGQIRHVFQPGSVGEGRLGHRSTPVSALALAGEETSVISGGWDANLLEWDLHTGQAIRSYEGMTGQISSLSFRPLIDGSIPETNGHHDPTDRMNGDGDVTVTQSPAESVDSLFDDGDGEPDPSILSESVRLEPVTKSGRSVPNAFEPGLPALSDQVFLASGIDGQVLLWDRRQDSNARAARKFELGSKTPPWSAQASWTADGQTVIVGRRNETVDLYDLRARQVRTLRLPAGSGAISSVRSLANSRQIICASQDNIRQWFLDRDDGEPSSRPASKMPFRIISGHHGATISDIVLDDTGRYMFTASGNRDLVGSGGTSDSVTIYELRPR
ncbi:uncharacterized protein L969DRAFT_53124 [Mixia osmundae IAM 14324]|uniref:Transcription factor spt8 beta-propeller domain-containing protein n=1 Tax=Mixia osmundae (strain CBS 9802 / IAM 14324 / JCM 22182 / KY 12970) TaxID=764103 RepID=G7DWM1_MIXOS|nr:uncharacterized protein L969DRAFT_53124 [Mixia osmundae IAM 14324]KEI37382.1 hypothetical protein L969DRAFT_53124 [Mixia osmundae IAM 14324]GAA94981.1 hypothetical protein E5Q_01636 [Mixia osmundae IAM 14324]